ncbi:MAG: hypothetical protein OEW11_11440 [Nitrospirota bacterium]|nr:hypothetical protein [Nitrospirota bacterium]
MDLTPEENALVGNAPWLLAKGSATTKLRDHLEAAHLALMPLVLGEHRDWLCPEGFDIHAVQVARGESLHGTPYQYLDFPKYFRRDEAFTFRTLIWWGRALCICWILQGPHLAERRRALAERRLVPLPGMGAWFGGDPWDWEGFVPLDSVPPEALEASSFLKVGRMLPLTPEVLGRSGLSDAVTDTFHALLPLVARG